MQNYLKISQCAILAAMWTYDNAKGAEKMLLWENIGSNNVAWQEGPYISAPSNEKQIDHSFPYCFRISKAHSMVAGIVMGSSPQREENGGVKIPMPPINSNNSRVEPVIAKLVIIEQFEIFKDLMMRINGPYNKKSCDEWKSKIDDKIIELLKKMTDRRNELTHDLTYTLPTIDEAVSYFCQLRKIAKLIDTITASSD